MIKYSSNKYLRSEDPDFNSDFANNMDSSDPYFIFSTPMTEDYIHNGDNLIVEDDSDFIQGDGEDLKYSIAINNYKNIVINCDKTSRINILALLDNVCKNKYSKTIISLKNDASNISNIIKNSEYMGLDFKDRMGAYRAIHNPSRKKFSMFKVFDDEFYFKTHVADTYSKKVAGLQTINKLERDHCMLFEYNNPQNLSFHMASVKYPIDIIFLDKNNKIQKIAKNIPPGDCGVYSCNNSLSVVEINGGLSDKLGFRQGTQVRFFDGMNNDTGSRYLIRLSSLLDLDKSTISFFKNSNHYKYNLNNLLKSSIDVNFKTASLNTNINSGLIEELKWGFCKEAAVIVDDSEVNIKYLNLFLKELFASNGLDNLNYSLIYSPSKDIVKLSSYNYGNFYYLDNKLYKHSSFDISNEYKEVANNINSDLKRGKKIFTRVIKDLKKNLKAYKKISDKPEVIRGSKGQLANSFKRISERYRGGLLKIKEIVDLLDSIKDASKTLELMSGLVNSCKQCSIALKDYFDTIDDLDSEEFMTNFEQKTNDTEKIFEDLHNSISSLQEFIYKHILGLTIIS